MNILTVSDWTHTTEGEPRGYIDPQALKELWFHTGTACNLACPFCLEGSKPGYLGIVAGHKTPYFVSSLD